MGIGSSTAAGSGMRVPDETLLSLRRICGDEAIPFDSEIWVEAIAQPTPIHTLDQDLVFEAIREVGPSLGTLSPFCNANFLLQLLLTAVKNVGATRNLTTLLAQIHLRLPRVAFMVYADVMNTASAICLCRHLIFWLLRNVPAQTFAAQLSTGTAIRRSSPAPSYADPLLRSTGSNPGVQPNSELDELSLQAFVAGVFDFLADVPFSVDCHDVHLELLSLMLALLSTQLRCANASALPKGISPQPVPESILPPRVPAATQAPGPVPHTEHPIWDVVFRAAWDTGSSAAALKAAGLGQDPMGAPADPATLGSMRAARVVRRLLHFAASPPAPVRGSAAVDVTTQVLRTLDASREGASLLATTAAPSASAQRDILDTLGELAATVVLSPLHLLAAVWGAASTTDGAATPVSPLLHRAVALLLLLVHSHRSSGSIPNPFRHFFVGAVDKRTTIDGDSTQEDDGAAAAADGSSSTSADERGDGEQSAPPPSKGINPLAPRGALEGKVYVNALQKAGPLRVHFAQLIQSLSQPALQPLAPALLYTLLYDNADFRAHLLSSADLTDVLDQHLRQVYHSAAFSPGHRYVSLIVLLMLSQDAELTHTLHTQLHMDAVPWVKERRVAHCSVGSLCMLILLRVLHVNLVEWKDAYITSNCMAALANFSRTLEGAHPGLSQRLVNVVLLVARLLQRSAAAYTAACAAGEGVDPPPKNNTQLVVSLFRACNNYAMLLQQLLGLIATCCRQETLGSNLHIVYALLYRYEPLQGVLQQLQTPPPQQIPPRAAAAMGLHGSSVATTPSNSAPAVDWSGSRALLEGVMPLLDHCVQRVKAAQAAAEDTGDASIGEDGTMAALRSGVQSWLTSQARSAAEAAAAENGTAGSEAAGQLSDRVYRYDEMSAPEEFFVPYLWSTVLLLTPDLCWDSSHIRLVAVPSEVDMRREEPAQVPTQNTEQHA